MDNGQEFDAVVKSLGHLGDGVAEGPYGQIFVPFALPGERLRLRSSMEGKPELLSVIEASADRVAPACRHFGTCGGCAMQHLNNVTYAKWKHGLVETALAARGLETLIEPLVEAAPHQRRRATFAATRTKKGVTLGFYEAGTHSIVAVEQCPLLVPEIEKAMQALAHLVEPGLSRKGRASLAVTATEIGLDVAVSGGKEELDLALRTELAARASAADLARLCWNGEILAERRPPIVALGKLRIAPPPGAFLQATRQGEEALVRLVREAVAGASRIADLFAGCGTFTASLAETAQVLAVEGDNKALASLDKAVRSQGPKIGLKPVTLLTRDLFRRPMLASELVKYEAVVFDPPRAGAEAQVRELAKSRIPVIIGVSCNPATFARDARLLVDGGYRLERVTPVDQFLWSPHVELVGVFSKD